MTTVKSSINYINSKSTQALKVPSASALVLGLSCEDSKARPVKSVKSIKVLADAFNVLSNLPAFEGKAASVVSLLEHSEGLKGLSGYRHLIGFGVGSPKDFVPQNILSWGGKLAQVLRSGKYKNVDIQLDSFFNAADSAKSKDAPKDGAGRPTLSGLPSKEEFLEKFVVGYYLALYKFDRYKSKAKDSKKAEEAPTEVRILSTLVDEKKAKSILEKARILAEAAYLTRDLQTTPGGDMQPAEIARQAQQAGQAAGFHVTVWDEKKLKTENMNGILFVGMGSDAPPRFIIMEHNASKKNLPTVVFVGKGVSFDTGGISIKPSLGMDEMKMDMSGSAAVIGAMYALTKLKAPIRAIGLVASAENMPSGKAGRPGDIYTAHDGQTIEVLNTDAEGRLVLADALSYAKTYKPDAVIDIATLTGAVVMALGHYASGIMGNDSKLIEGFQKASDKTGERTWELPLYDEYANDMKSKIADYRNIGTEKGGGSQKGGAFLNFFVKDAYPWIHLDVAGTADTPSAQGDHCPPHVGTAVPMRSLVEFALNFEDYFKRK